MHTVKSPERGSLPSKIRAACGLCNAPRLAHAGDGGVTGRQMLGDGTRSAAEMAVNVQKEDNRPRIKQKKDSCIFCISP